MNDVTIGLAKGRADAIVDQIDLSIAAGRTAALVGPSGSGKTLLARAAIDLLPRAMRQTGGRILISRSEMERRKRSAFIFQEPLSSLNPSLRIGWQITEAILKRGLAPKLANERAEVMLEQVLIPNPRTVLRSYPHELSGGMRQRVMIAGALLAEPALIVADEPTTALDMIVRRDVLTLLKRLAIQNNAALLLITHDLSAVAEIADDVHVMAKGRIVESGPVGDVIRRPEHPASRELVGSIPRAGNLVAKSCVDADAVLALRNIVVKRPGGGTPILRSVSCDVLAGETLGIIGESGSGKTTFARVVADLMSASGGTVTFKGQPLVASRRDYRGQRQFIFQDPFASLDPRMRVRALIAEPLRRERGLGQAEKNRRIKEALSSLSLPEDSLGRYPHELSGGQRQRVAIARAIVGRPSVIIADEPVSALDLAVQKQVIDLLADLQREFGFACVLVTHDLGVIEGVADRIAVMRAGQFVEIGPRREIFTRPHHPYTRALLGATAYLADVDNGYELRRRTFVDIAVSEDVVSQEQAIQYREISPGHLVACRIAT